MGLPGQDGWWVGWRIRELAPTPIIILSARAEERDEEMDQALALTIGGDDQGAKPFSPRQLTARAQAILRHGQSAVPESTLKRGELTLDLASYQTFWDDLKGN
ncbi:MAG: hypothetical protein LBT86_06010 [Deltaproteobacteria bacterium]|nr:hypothetical protein [Deltaproteobacteria bacterium]